MFCRGCGARLDDGARFCATCGQPTSGPIAPPGQRAEQGTGLNPLVSSLIFWAVLVVVGVAIWYYASAQQSRFP